MHSLVLLTWLVASTPGEAQALAGDAGTSRTAAPTQTSPDSAAPAPGETRKVSEFVLIRKNGDRIEGRSGSLTASRFTGISADGRKLELLREDIDTLYHQEGSQAGVMGLYGAGIGLVLSGVITLRAVVASPDAFRNETVANVSAAFVGGSTLLGGLIGLCIGAGQSRWIVEPLVVPGQQYSLRLSHSL